MTQSLPFVNNNQNLGATSAITGLSGYDIYLKGVIFSVNPTGTVTGVATLSIGNMVDNNLPTELGTAPSVTNGSLTMYIMPSTTEVVNTIIPFNDGLVCPGFKGTNPLIQPVTSLVISVTPNGSDVLTGSVSWWGLLEPID